MATKPNDDKQIAPDEGQATKPEVSKVTESDPLSGKSTDNSDEGKTDFDVQKSHEELKKSYQEIRSEFTRTSQHRAELEKQLTSLGEQNQEMAERLAEATAAPYNPEQFMEDFKTQGPRALEPFFDARLKKVQDKNDKTVQGLIQQNVGLSSKLEVVLRRNDVNYPDFYELEPQMKEIAESTNCPVNLQQPIPDVIDALYKLAKESKSADAVNAAVNMGKQQNEAELAKEAATAVAGGGKTPSVVTANDDELRNMPLDKLEEAVMKQYGEAQR